MNYNAAAAWVAAMNPAGYLGSRNASYRREAMAWQVRESEAASGRRDYQRRNGNSELQRKVDFRGDAGSEA